MKFLKKLKQKIIKSNKDIIYYYKLTLYSSNMMIFKKIFFRYLFILKLIFEKYILRKNFFKKIEKLKNKISIYNESRINNKNNPYKILELAINKEIIFVDIYDVLFSKNIDFRYINNSVNKEHLIYINLYGKNILDVLKQNNKEVVLLLNDETIPIDKVKYYLEKNNICYNDICFCTGDRIFRDINLKKIIKEKYNKFKSFMYIGRYFYDNLDSPKIDLEVIAYENCGFWGNKFRPNNDSNLKISIYNEIINNKMHSDEKKYNKYYEFGFIYGGIITYYIFVEMILNNQSFENEYSKFKKNMYNKLNSSNVKYLEKNFNTIFPTIVNNFIYDKEKILLSKDIKDVKIYYQKDIQQGIIDFCSIFEEKLTNVVGDNIIKIDEIKIIIDFLLKNKLTVKRRKIW